MEIKLTLRSQVELTDEDILEFRPKGDIASAALSKSLSNFTIPEESEGFHAVAWRKGYVNRI